MDPRDGITVVYTLAALSALAACWLWFRSPTPSGAMPEAGTAAALALGLSGGGYLISLFL
jgi:hypothetical protein